MEIKKFNKEFVERTKKLIEQADVDNCEYEITLLINCMLALVLLPIEKTKNGDTFISLIVAELKRMNIFEDSTNDDKKSFRAIKNALSHMNIEIKNSNGAINEIVFWDKYPQTNQPHTILKFNTKQLKDFALFVASKHLERLSYHNKNK